MVQKIPTSHPDVWELSPAIKSDPRGFFMETYHQQKFANLGIHEIFVQDNQSFSRKNTLRGLHYQLKEPQAKICRVVQGAVLDVAVDIRRGSPNFGEWTSVVLSARKRNELYIPAGFAHGFLVLTTTATFVYKCSALYNGDDDMGIAWNDPRIGIKWGFKHPVVSDRDENHPTLDSLSQKRLPRYR